MNDQSLNRRNSVEIKNRGFIENEKVDEIIDREGGKSVIDDSTVDDIKKVRGKNVGIGPNRSIEVDSQSHLLTIKKNGSGKTTTCKKSKKNSPSVLVKPRICQQTPKSNKKKRGQKDNLNVKSVKSGSPSIKLSKKFWESAVRW